MLPAQKTFALSFCLRDRPIRPYTFGTRFLRASPECGTPGAPGGTSCDFVLPLCTAVHSRKTLSYFRLLGKPFTAFYAPVSSFIPEGEFYFGMTFSCLYRSMGGTSSGLPSASSHSSAFSWGGRWGTGSPSGSSSGGSTRSFGPSAPSKPWARPSGLASPSRWGRCRPAGSGGFPPWAVGWPRRDDSPRLPAALPQRQPELHPCAGPARGADRSLRDGRSRPRRLLPGGRPGPLPGSTALCPRPARGHPLPRPCALGLTGHR